MKKHALGLLTGVLIAAAAPAAAHATTVTVRVEGATATIVPRQTVTLPTAAFRPDGTHDCAADSIGAALQIATGGDWAGGYDSGFGAYSLDRIKTETAPFGWWLNTTINGAPAQLGVCDQPLAQGDELVVFPNCWDVAGCGGDRLLLVTSGPATATLGLPYALQVEQLSADGATRTPAAAAAVAAPGGTVTTDVLGRALIALPQRGLATIAVSKAGTVRTAAQVCVTDGADGFCGTTAAPGVTPPPASEAGVDAAAVPCSTSGRDGRCGTADTTQPWSHLSTPKHGARYRRASAPRTLSGTIEADGSGIAKVELRLTRRSGKTCQSYSGSAERFVRVSKCGAESGVWFRIGNGQDWSYLLPSALAAGRYVLDVRVTDKAGNTTKLARSYTRSVFVVA